MKRIFQAIALASLWTVGVGAQAQNTIYYLDPETQKEEVLDTAIKMESPGGITVPMGDGEKLIPALDIVQVTYKVSGITALEFRAPDNELLKALEPGKRPEDRKSGLQNALRDFEDLGQKVAGDEKASRYVKYRTAQIKGLIAQDDPTKMNDAVEALNTFQLSNSKGWEIVPALKQLAQLEESRNNVEGAIKAYDALTVVPNVPVDIQRQASFLVAQLLLRRNQANQAESRLTTLKEKMTSKDPQLPMVDVLLTQAQMAQNKLDNVEKQLNAALKATTDNDIRAIAHNVMGDYLDKKNQPKEAFWQYLRVDVMYPQDPEQHAKALYHLWKLFASAKGDPQRAEECYTRLMAETYAGTEFQLKARGEKKE